MRYYKKDYYMGEISRMVSKFISAVAKIKVVMLFKASLIFLSGITTEHLFGHTVCSINFTTLFL